MWLSERGAMALLFGGAFIRYGNFLNQEILGKHTDSFFRIIYVQIDNIPRHPVQLYEAFAYLVLGFLFLFIYLKKNISPVRCYG